MGRAPRVDSSGGWFHVVNRGVARQPIFFDDRDRIEFGRLLEAVHERFGVVTHAYCLMSNHYHLLLECPDGGLSGAMHQLGSVFVRHVNDRSGRDGPLFKDRFYAKPVTTDAYLLRLVAYIHRNPLAMLPEDELIGYRWSSLRSYAGFRRVVPWLRTERVAEIAGGAGVVVDHAMGTTDLGPDAPTGRAVMALVELLAGDVLDALPSKGTVRAVAALLLDRVDDQTAATLRADLGYPSLNAERIAACRARQRAASEPVLMQSVDAVIDALSGRFHFVPGTK